MPSYTRLPELIDQLDAIRPGLPILITEFGWTTAVDLRAAELRVRGRAGVYLRQAIGALRGDPARAPRCLVQRPGQRRVDRGAWQRRLHPEAVVGRLRPGAEVLPRGVSTAAIARGAGRTMTDFIPGRDVQAISHLNVVVDDIEAGLDADRTRSAAAVS